MAIVPKLRWLFWFLTYVRDDFNGLKWTGFLAESHLFAFNTLRIVYSVEKHMIIDCITHLLLMTLHSERSLIGRYPIWFTDVFSKSYFYFVNHLWKRFHVFKKVRNISRFDWDRQSRMRDYHLSLHALGKVKTNRPRASQICIGVTIVLSIKTQSPSFWLAES